MLHVFLRVNIGNLYTLVGAMVIQSTHNVALQRFKDQNSKVVFLRYVIQLKCAVLQCDSGAAWLQDNNLVAQVSKVLTPAKEMRVRD